MKKLEHQSVDDILEWHNHLDMWEDQVKAKEEAKAQLTQLLLEGLPSKDKRASDMRYGEPRQWFLGYNQAIDDFRANIKRMMSQE